MVVAVAGVVEVAALAAAAVPAAEEVVPVVAALVRLVDPAVEVVGLAASAAVWLAAEREAEPDHRVEISPEASAAAIVLRRFPRVEVRRGTDKTSVAEIGRRHSPRAEMSQETGRILAGLAEPEIGRAALEDRVELAERAALRVGQVALAGQVASEIGQAEPVASVGPEALQIDRADPAALVVRVALVVSAALQIGLALARPSVQV